MPGEAFCARLVALAGDDDAARLPCDVVEDRLEREHLLLLHVAGPVLRRHEGLVADAAHLELPVHVDLVLLARLPCQLDVVLDDDVLRAILIEDRLEDRLDDPLVR